MCSCQAAELDCGWAGGGHLGVTILGGVGGGWGGVAGGVTGGVKGSEREGGGTVVMAEVVGRPGFGSRLSSYN